MVERLRHRQTKGAETDLPTYRSLRHIPTLPHAFRRHWDVTSRLEVMPGNDPTSERSDGAVVNRSNVADEVKWSGKGTAAPEQLNYLDVTGVRRTADQSGFKPYPEATAFQAVECSPVPDRGSAIPTPLGGMGFLRCPYRLAEWRRTSGAATLSGTASIILCGRRSTDLQFWEVMLDIGAESC